MFSHTHNEQFRSYHFQNYQGWQHKEHEERRTLFCETMMGQINTHTVKFIHKTVNTGAEKIDIFTMPTEPKDLTK